MEREARDQKLSGPASRALRQARSKSILDDIEVYLEAERAKALPKSPASQAIAWCVVELGRADPLL